jgi:hypothetical protein
MALPGFQSSGILAIVSEGTSDITPGLPASHSLNNLLLMPIHSFLLYSSTGGTATSSFTTPAGWGKVLELYDQNSFGDAHMSFALFSSIDDGAMAAPTVTRSNTSGTMTGYIIAISGNDTTSPFVSSNARSMYSSDVELGFYTKHSTLDTLGILLDGGARPGVSTAGAEPPRVAGWSQNVICGGGFNDGIYHQEMFSKQIDNTETSTDLMIEFNASHQKYEIRLTIVGSSLSGSVTRRYFIIN